MADVPPHHAFVSHRGDFDSRSFLRSHENRNHRRQRKVDGGNAAVLAIEKATVFQVAQGGAAENFGKLLFG
jgi:hypothetical protein